MTYKKMTKTEIDIQKQIVIVFEKIKKELPLLSKAVIRLGYKQRNELISHVYSDYTRHEELNSARDAWNKMIVTENVHQWLYDHMVKHRDLWGYFENCNEMIEEIEIIKSAAVRKEEYHIADVLTKWQNEFPQTIKNKKRCTQQ